ncbi:hypothetical protein HanRHA438_Chr16g0740981 [Helianthus annuus]|nr:hypothetical protein HanRHA438_Chr16g0740981 [Helianthus annuus]
MELACDVWMMLKNSVPKSSFTKLFCVKVRCYSCLIGFRKNGQLMHEGDGELEVYNGLGIYGSLFQMASYTESLFLLNHPDSIIH